jgi:hypothetical protein
MHSFRRVHRKPGYRQDVAVIAGGFFGGDQKQFNRSPLTMTN